MVDYLYFGRKSHVSNGQNVSCKEPCIHIYIYTHMCVNVGQRMWTMVYTFTQMGTLSAWPDPGFRQQLGLLR